MHTSSVLRTPFLAASLVVCCSLPHYDFQDPPVLEDHCDDGMRDGTQTDVDCGGNVCMPCAVGRACLESTDCAIENCHDQRCQAEHCYNQMLDETETTVDCGGPDCMPCGFGQNCVEASDCSSNSCVDGVCIPTTCDNEELDQGETDINCGGVTCPDCELGRRCSLSGDCVSGLCVLEHCTTEICSNGSKDKGEEGVDCGGGCPTPCSDCSDGEQSPPESDIDCGGGACKRCDEGQGCNTNQDCVTGLCLDAVCTKPPPTCEGDACEGEGDGGAGGAGGTAGEAGAGGASGAGEGGAVNEMGGRSSGGTTSMGGTGSGGRVSSGGTGQGGTSGGSGGTMTSGGSSGMGTGGVPTMVPEPTTCAGCARLSVPLANASDKANFAINLPGVTNFSNGIITVRVYKQAGSGGELKIYVQYNGNPDYSQLFQSTPLELSAFAGWQDVTWNVGAQSTTSFNKTNVGRVGVQISGLNATSWTNPTVVYIDSMSVQNAGTGPWNFDNSNTVNSSQTTNPGSTNVLFCNSGDSPVPGATVTWFNR